MQTPACGTCSSAKAIRFGYLAALACLLGACSSDLTGPAAEACGEGPYFSALPVALADIDAIAVVGGLGAPGHTLPTAHTGFYLATEGAAVRAPAEVQITGLRRTRYVSSPNRQGHEDYTADFRLCRDVSGWFGHLASIVERLQVPESDWRDCQQYSTAIETVQTCQASPDRVVVVAGELIGTGGFSIALGLMGLDFGLLDARVENFHVAAWRHPEPSFRSICPWEQFEPTLRTQLYVKLADKGRPGIVPAGEPRCGTMEVDVAGTAKGVWAEPGVTQPAAGDETRYITLANYPYRPEDHLALSLGPAALGAMVAVVPRATAGRVNRAFESVIPDGLVHCYGPDIHFTNTSWLLSLTGPSALSIRRVSHASGAGPCADDPATWSLVGATAMVR